MPSLDPAFALAAACAAATAATHVVVGGRYVARPLLAARDLHRVAKYTAYYCWHMVTIVLVAMAAGYGLAATDTVWRPLAQAATGLAVAFALLSLALVAVFRMRPWLMPQWALFLATAAAGLWALA